MDDEVFKNIGIVTICIVVILAVLCMCYCIRQFTMPEAKAKPVTTEIPEYTMKCTVFEDTCKEYTIYRITRN